MNSFNNDALAVIGLAGRFPGAPTPARFWANLRAGHEAIAPVPPDRWAPEDHFTSTPGTPGKSHARWGGFLADVARFDAAFFGIDPAEAALMDPQHRLLLELAFAALENGGYAGPRRRERRVGVFIGIAQNNYEEFTRPHLFATEHAAHPNLMPNNLRNLAAGRVAHTLNLTGPTVTLDTACSSALVALHYARLSLLAGDCDLALVGAASLNLTATPFIAFSSAGALASIPHVHAFDERAAGLVLGEGGGLLLLSRLDDAEHAGDSILALVRGTAVNNDGRSHGIMAPHPAGQSDVLKQAYDNAGIDPNTVSYVEAHGTGTRIGDAVEARSLGRFFRPRRDGQPRYLGSVKGNIGHLLCAAGSASLQKVILMLRHRDIPPHINAEQPRSRLRLSKMGFTLNGDPQPWSDEAPRRAGVNAFGFGGTNAHVILEEAPPLAERPAASGTLWLVSAPTAAGLQRRLRQLADTVTDTPWRHWSTLAFSVNDAAPAYPFRAAAAGHDDLPARLHALAQDSTPTAAPLAWRGAAAPASPRLAFTCPDPDLTPFGPQLYQEMPPFRPYYDAVINAWTAETGARATDTALTTLAATIALARLLAAWGITPQVIVSSGRGHLAAAHLTGRLPLAVLPRQFQQTTLPLPAAADDTPAWHDASGARLPAAAFDLELTTAATRTPPSPSAAADHHFDFPAARGRGRMALETALAQWWTAGGACIPAAVERPRRLPVPPYPFAPTRHWVDNAPRASLAPGPAMAPPAPDTSWLHEVAWLPAPPESGTENGGDALLLAPAGSELITAWNQDRPGTALPFRAWQAQPRAAAALVLALAPTAGREAIAKLLGVARAAAALPPVDRPQRLILVTRGAFAIPEQSGPLNPHHAAAAAAALALAAEWDRPVTVVDLAAALATGQVVDRLGMEVAQRAITATFAWRQGQRLQRQLQALTGAQPPFALPADGAYLITGGGGSVGAAVARHLALAGTPTLFLLGRRDAAEPALAQLLAHLRWAGATVHYLAADVTDEVAMTEAVRFIHDQTPHLTGIIHAAGNIQPGRLLRTTPAALADILTPKIEGVETLWRTVQAGALPFDFLACFSSITPLEPAWTAGLGAYAAANGFLDTWAAARRRAGHPVTSINWTYWRQSDAGAAGAAALTATGLIGLDDAHGVANLALALGQARGQVVVVKVDRGRDAKRDRDREKVSASGGVREIVSWLRELLARELEIEPAAVATDVSFAALGLDSMVAIDLILVLEEKGYGPLSPALFFEYQTIDEIAAYLAQRPAIAPAASDVVAAPPSAGGERPLPLTDVQRAFYANARLQPEAVAFACVTQQVRGPWDRAALQQAAIDVSRRHPLLRAFFDFDAATGAPRQHILPAGDARATPRIRVENDPADADSVTTIVNQPFSLDHPPLWRLLVTAPVTAAATPWQLTIHAHHIIADGWSLNVLAQDLWHAYTARLRRSAPTWDQAPAAFVDYVTARAAQADGNAGRAATAWWRIQRQHFPQGGLPLPYDAPAGAPGRRQAFIHHLDATITAQLKATAAAHDVSLFHLLLAVYARLLQQVTEQAHIPINVAAAGRGLSLPGLQHMVGCCADVYPVVVPATAALSLPALARQVKARWLACQQHTQISSVAVLRLAPPAAAGTGASPLALSPAAFSFARFPAALPDGAPLTVTAVTGRTATAATRLSLVGWEFAGQLGFSWNYSTADFQPATVATMAQAFARLLSQAVAPAPSPADAGPTVAMAQPETTTPSFLTRIDQNLAHTPYRPALRFQDRAWNYGELAAGIGQIQNALAAANLDPGAVVAYVGRPAPAAVAALLAVLKSGATWLPLSPDDPPARLRRQLSAADAALLLCPPDQHTLANQLDRPLQLLDFLSGHIPAPAQPAQSSRANGQNQGATPAPAYIIFTSGSTGTPRGVPITRAALDRYLAWAAATFAYTAADRVMAATSLNFDASLRLLLAPLAAGGTVCPVAAPLLRQPAALFDWLLANEITVWSSVPSLWLTLLDELERRVAAGDRPVLPALRLVQLGGEALPAAAVRRWFDLMGNDIPLVNLYGPTENTINATYHFIRHRPADDTTHIPIGGPLPGVELRVETEVETETEMETGATGELFIGGVNLTPGYLDGDDSRFRVSDDGHRFFRSGDMVRRQVDGGLIFLGRRDQQVKLRGYRLELGEIETHLAQHPAVRRAVVLALPPDRPRTLRAFLETDDPPPTQESLHDFLAGRLPAYMIPAGWHTLARLPELANGKIDRPALRERATAPPLTPLPRTPGTPPRTDDEKLLANIWQDVLAVADIQREDDFFRRGGDSLKLLAVFAALERAGRPVASAASLYQQRTLATQAKLLAASPSPPPLPDRAEGPFPLSPAQAGFVLARRLAPAAATAWSARFLLRGPLDRPTFAAAAAALLARHPMLRTVYQPGSRPPRQAEIEPAGPLPLTYVDAAAGAATPADRAQIIAAQQAALLAEPFDLSQWPLLRMRLCRLAPAEHMWFVAADHFIGDGFSGWLFGGELLQTYDDLRAGRKPALSPLTGSFRDYVAVAAAAARDVTPATAAYWQHTFATPYTPPQDWYRPAADESTWLNHTITLTPRQLAALRRRAGQVGRTPHDLLLGLFSRRLAHLTGRADLVVGTAVAGRDYPVTDLMRIFGSFATILPLRLTMEGNELWADINQAAATFATANAHRLAPRHIARQVGSDVPLSVVTGLQFFFSFMDFTILPQPASHQLTIDWAQSRTELQPPRLGTDIVLTARALADGLRLTLTGGGHALDKAGLAAVGADLLAELNQVIANPVPIVTSPAARLASNAREREASATLNAALIAYLPPETEVAAILQELDLPLSPAAVRDLLFAGQQAPLLETITTSLGRTGTLCLSFFADELAGLAAERLAAAVAAAVMQAGSRGADCVSLAGMLPAHTRYGHAVLAQLPATGAPTLTTGHSLTVVSVVKTVARALTHQQRALADAHLAILGVGAIGGAALRLLLAELGRPARLTLVDVPGSRRRLEHLAATLPAAGFDGPVDLLYAAPAAAAGLYAADLIVGATSQGNVLDVDRLRPGTIVVDDSFPHCFDPATARARMRRRGDVLIVGGGLLDPGPFTRRLHLPPGAPPGADAILGYLPHLGLASCQLEGLLWANRPVLPLTHGPAEPAGARAYWQAAQVLDLTAAPLHLGRYEVGA